MHDIGQWLWDKENSEYSKRFTELYNREGEILI
jgi:hypothetical protein